jgi:hypothetical protein
MSVFWGWDIGVWAIGFFLWVGAKILGGWLEEERGGN